MRSGGYPTHPIAIEEGYQGIKRNWCRTKGLCHCCFALEFSSFDSIDSFHPHHVFWFLVGAHSAHHTGWPGSGMELQCWTSGPTLWPSTMEHMLMGTEMVSMWTSPLIQMRSHRAMALSRLQEFIQVSNHLPSFYVDGSAVNLFVCVQIFPCKLVISYYSSLGCTADNTDNNHYPSLRMDEVGFWNKALTPEDVIFIMNYGNWDWTTWQQTLIHRTGLHNKWNWSIWHPKTDKATEAGQDASWVWSTWQLKLVKMTTKTLTITKSKWDRPAKNFINANKRNTKLRLV